MGAERRSMVMSEDEKKTTAYHESGHAVVAWLLPKSDPVHKVTIVPRGRALGVTMQLPEKDRFNYDDVYMRSRLAILFAGRAAEEVFLGQKTTGASNDFERATQLARDMVTRYGMTDAMGVMVYAENEGEVFLGRSVTRTTHVSEATQQAIDKEVRRILEEEYFRAKKMLEENRERIELMVECLMKWETIDFDQINDIMEGREVRPPKEGSSAKTLEPLHPETKVEEKKEQAPVEAVAEKTDDVAQEQTKPVEGEAPVQDEKKEDK